MYLNELVFWEGMGVMNKMFSTFPRAEEVIYWWNKMIENKISHVALLLICQASTNSSVLYGNNFPKQAIGFKNNDPCLNAIPLNFFEESR